MALCFLHAKLYNVGWTHTLYSKPLGRHTVLPPGLCPSCQSSFDLLESNSQKPLNQCLCLYKWAVYLECFYSQGVNYSSNERHHRLLDSSNEFFIFSLLGEESERPDRCQRQWYLSCRSWLWPLPSKNTVLHSTGTILSVPRTDQCRCLFPGFSYFRKSNSLHYRYLDTPSLLTVPYGILHVILFQRYLLKIPLKIICSHNIHFLTISNDDKCHKGAAMTVCQIPMTGGTTLQDLNVVRLLTTIRTT